MVQNITSPAMIKLEGTVRCMSAVNIKALSGPVKVLAIGKSSPCSATGYEIRIIVLARATLQDFCTYSKLWFRAWACKMNSK